FSPANENLAAACSDGTVRVWDPSDGREVLRLSGDGSPIFSVTFSADGRRLAAGSYNHAVHVWDTASGEKVLALGGHRAPVTCLAFSPDGDRLASADPNQEVRISDTATGELQRSRTRFLGLKAVTSDQSVRVVYGLSFHPDGLRVA